MAASRLTQRTRLITTYVTGRVGVTCDEAKPIAKVTFQTQATVSGEVEKWSIEGWSCERTVSDTINNPLGPITCSREESRFVLAGQPSGPAGGLRFKP
ncbi:hypothetical protein nbrc107696_12250 [Gordonia spumicola]|uniref:Uncharacterized protein n=1 Tax=Gordonia spumicola TaxID=589161 RepID=A0A7I9V5Q4_9ACTN|nr:hypothetical protein nbrc107696_11910 [Gordonia spumicola]GEE00779.1 hypothetical protein nbrc107696_12250 [Gordonia spumicola]